jgi:hypothetical protein
MEKFAKAKRKKETNQLPARTAKKWFRRQKFKSAGKGKYQPRKAAQEGGGGKRAQ